MIENQYFYMVTGILAVGTFLIRFSWISLGSRVNLSARWQEILSFIPAAILPAMIAPMAFYHQGNVDWAFGKERMLVLILASLVCFKTKNMLVTITFGLVLLFIFSQTSI